MGTRRSEQKNFVNETPPQAGSNLRSYSMNPTDAMTQNVMTHEALQDAVSDANPGRELSGYAQNDDYYRRSRARFDADAKREVWSLARQLETKQDQEATIRVMTQSKSQKSGEATTKKGAGPLLNVIPPYTKFFLENVTESYAEKAQVVETFGDFIAFFFGRRPEMFSFSGRLLNVKNHDWKNDFVEMYDNFLRGTKAVENDSIVFIQYDDVMVQGFLMNCRLDYHSVANNECPFAFSTLITKRAPIYQLQRLLARAKRSRFSAAEQQLLDDIQKIKDEPIPFSIMQKALSAGGMKTADMVVHTEENNKIQSSDNKTINIDDIKDEERELWDNEGIPKGLVGLV